MKNLKPPTTLRSVSPLLLGICLLSGAFCLSARAQGTAFTYQGLLTEGGQPANGLYDFRAQIYSRASASEPGDALVSGTVTSTVGVSHGMFVLNLDFGAGPFNGESRWLLLEVRTNNTPNYTTLVPRQPITPTPYAIMSSRLAGLVAATQITGALSSSALPTGGNWALNSTLTLDTSTLAIDPVNDRVGIGTPTPAAPFHMIAGQGVVRLDSTANRLGSVLELRNNTASPTYLGAINFNDATGTYPGQIGYLGSHDLTFQVAGGERMRLSGEGRLDVLSANSTVAFNVIDAFQTIQFPKAVKAICDGVNGAAVAASSLAGVAVEAMSQNGYAGVFYGPVIINYASPFDKPQLTIKDPSDNGYARLRLKTGDRPLWDIAVGTGPGATNTLRFFSEGNGDVVSITPQGTLYTRVLTITGGADVAEPFAMSEPDLPKGAVVVIDEEHPGKLKLSTEPYDRRVAGVISGAGGVQTGLRLSQQGVMEGDEHVALTGRVYVQADVSNGAIKPGDLLTTSGTAGHAMKATDSTRTPGAVLGKAMTGLAKGDGLVLVLVTLQ